MRRPKAKIKPQPGDVIRGFNTGDDPREWVIEGVVNRHSQESRCVMFEAYRITSGHAVPRWCEHGGWPDYEVELHPDADRVWADYCAWRLTGEA